MDKLVVGSTFTWPNKSSRETELEQEYVKLKRYHVEVVDALDALCQEVGKLGGSMSEDLFKAFKVGKAILKEVGR